ncbi:unnamed protein product [Amoebophrya sp. A120]|nr:unnamed protein product [Amoebophrya sp. A120]|eukprot:GSA120T00008403001.1
MVVTTDSMFAGDGSMPGRREALNRKRAAKDAYTDKIGGGGFRADLSASNVNSGVFQGGAVAEPQSVVSTARSQFMPPTPTSASASVSENTTSLAFQQKISVKRTLFTLDLTCDFPIVDMEQNMKRRSLIFYCVVDQTGTKESVAIQVPLSFDLTKAKFTNDDFANGRCSMAIPAANSNALSWD